MSCSLEIEGLVALKHKQQAEIERLRALLIDAPILVIDERVARIMDENVCLEYMKAVREWHPKVKAALATNGERVERTEE